MKNIKLKIKSALSILIATTIFGAIGLVSTTYARTVNFSGYDWTVKETASGTTMGPGANNWGSTIDSDSNDARVDGDGKLHLFVSQRPDGQWYSNEVYLQNSLGYGTYTFDIESRLDLLDQNIVAAPFLYQDDNNEIDIEHSFWNGESGNQNLYYTVQPYNKEGNQQTQHLDLSDTTFQDIIYWEPNKVTFSTKQAGNELFTFTYTSSTDGTTNNFNPGNESVHINFWQYKGLEPATATTSELIIQAFSFTPYTLPTTTTSTPDPTPTPTTSATATVNLNIRYQNNFVFSGPVTLSTNTLITYNQNNTTSTASTTVLTALINASESTTTFSISDLQLSEYGYYLNCLYIENIATSTCGNWNYVVDNSYPAIGLGSYPLIGGENIYLYFGDSWKITTPNNTINANTSTPFYTWKYSYNDLNSEWILDPNDLVAITVPNPTPTGWWDTDITVSTTLSNDQGVAYYNFSSTGTYSAKITSVDYSKWSNPITFTVTNTLTEQTTSTTSTSGGSGGSNSPSNNLLSNDIINDTVNKLIDFIKSKQDNDGKIVDGGNSDWLTMTFASKNTYAENIKIGTSSLYDYVYNYNHNLLDSELNNCAAYPRHILAMLASGVSTNDTKITALKTKLDACVQNNNFGQTGINDDVFGLMAAIAIGENQNTPVIQTTLNAIKSNQEADGGFAYPGPFESPDLTGAAINALKYAQNNGASVETNIFTKAKQYLKTQQLADGGWGYSTSDALTTSWAVMGINALGEGQNDWFNTNGKNPWYVLTNLNNDHFTQAWDGNIDWFGTKHAVPALLGKSWPIILDPKLTTNNTGGGSSVDIATTTNSIATSTSTTPTTTLTTSTTTSTIPTTTPVITIETPKLEIKPVVLSVKPKIKNNEPRKINTVENNFITNKQATTTNEELKAGEQKQKENNTIDNLPLDTPTRRTAKKVMAVTGGSAAALGLYLGLRLIKNVI